MAKVLQRARVTVEIENGVAVGCATTYVVADSVDPQLQKEGGLDLGLSGDIGAAVTSLTTQAIAAINTAEGIS